MKENTSTYAIILAGGSGTRLWPMSRKLLPKQLIKIFGDRSLLQETAARLLDVIADDHIYTIVHQDQKFLTVQQLQELNPNLGCHVLAEPCSRNTLPAISWVVSEILKKDPEATISVFSADHFIERQDVLHSALLRAFDVAQKFPMVLFGTVPDFASTGYGYIELGDVFEEKTEPQVFHVKSFKEKPDSKTAQAYLESNKYVWNTGMFIFKASVFMSLLQRFQPQVFELVQKIQKEGMKEELYQQMPKLSVDYGILEFLDEISVIPCSMGWSDIGSWDSLWSSFGKSESSQNVIRGNVIDLESENCLLWSESGQLATAGLKDTIVVQTRDATLVCDRNASQKVKDLVEQLRQKGSKETENELLDVHTTVQRPWGEYTVLENTDEYKVKRVCVDPQQSLSLQLHNHRHEHWVVVRGVATIVCGEEVKTLERNESTFIPQGYKHQIRNETDETLEIIEVQVGHYLGEDDIVRFEDRYGRVR